MPKHIRKIKEVKSKIKIIKEIKSDSLIEDIKKAEKEIDEEAKNEARQELRSSEFKAPSLALERSVEDEPKQETQIAAETRERKELEDRNTNYTANASRETSRREYVERRFEGNVEGHRAYQHAEDTTQSNISRRAMFRENEFREKIPEGGIRPMREEAGRGDFEDESFFDNSEQQQKKRYKTRREL